MSGAPAHAGRDPTGQGERIWAEARALIGVRFRPHGRDIVYGLDCVGVALAALRGAGARIGDPPLYTLRGGPAARLSAAFGALGLAARAGPPCVGDIALLRLAPERFHVAVIGPDSVIHAHAGLRRVVETPGAPEGNTLDGEAIRCWHAPETMFAAPAAGKR